MKTRLLLTMLMTLVPLTSFSDSHHTVLDVCIALEGKPGALEIDPSVISDIAYCQSKANLADKYDSSALDTCYGIAQGASDSAAIYSAIDCLDKTANQSFKSSVGSCTQYAEDKDQLETCLNNSQGSDTAPASSVPTSSTVYEAGFTCKDSEPDCVQNYVDTLKQNYHCTDLQMFDKTDDYPQLPAGDHLYVITSSVCQIMFYKRAGYYCPRDTSAVRIVKDVKICLPGSNSSDNGAGAATSPGPTAGSQ